VPPSVPQCVPIEDAWSFQPPWSGFDKAMAEIRYQTVRIIPALSANAAPSGVMRGPRRRSEIRLHRQLGMQAPDCVGQIERAVEQPAWRAVVKTFTYRVIVTTIDFGANYFVTGELTTAAGMSSLSLVAGPIAYFAHEAAWHYYGPASARQPNPLEATVHVPIPGAAQGEENGRTRFASVKVSRALAKTVTYEVVTAVSEFGANHLFVRDLAAAAGLTAFSIVIAPFVYYVHEKAWDCYDATKARSSPSVPALKLLPAA
jgi:uncharacterized membrane protein